MLATITASMALLAGGAILLAAQHDVVVVGQVRDLAGRSIPGFRLDYAVLRTGLLLPRVGARGTVVTDRNGRYRIRFRAGLTTTALDIAPDDTLCRATPFAVLIDADRFGAAPFGTTQPTINFRCTAQRGR